MDWSLSRWNEVYRIGSTDAYGDLDELARYGILAGYLSHIGGYPRVLDVGCGNGLLRSRIDPTKFSHYVGIDHAEAAIEQARIGDYERTSFLVGDLCSLEIGKFDMVICNEVLYFVPDPQAFLERLWHVLNPGGHLLVSIFRHPGDFVLWRLLEERFGLVDRVWVRNERNRIGWRGWGLAMLVRR
jgi:2-polyprenyl-6-hydroxyphenyl methylase/3-demethylubiquinone-9 3-methyltransferase